MEVKRTTTFLKTKTFCLWSNTEAMIKKEKQKKTNTKLKTSYTMKKATVLPVLKENNYILIMKRKKKEGQDISS